MPSDLDSDSDSFTHLLYTYRLHLCAHPSNAWTRLRMSMSMSAVPVPVPLPRVGPCYGDAQQQNRGGESSVLCAATHDSSHVGGASGGGTMVSISGVEWSGSESGVSGLVASEERHAHGPLPPFPLFLSSSASFVRSLCHSIVSRSTFWVTQPEAKPSQAKPGQAKPYDTFSPQPRPFLKLLLSSPRRKLAGS